MKIHFHILIGILTYLSTLYKCDNISSLDENPMPVNGKIEVVSPKAGAVFKLGDTATITFKINADKVKGADIQIATGTMEHWYAINKQPLLPDTNQAAQILSYPWFVGYEPELVDYNDDYVSQKKCYLRIKDHSDETIADSSDIFYVALVVGIFLRQPLENDTFNFNDTIPIIYTFRIDMADGIQIFFSTDNGQTYPDENEIIGKFSSLKTLHPTDSTQVRTYTKKWVPKETHPTAPGNNIRLLLRDYVTRYSITSKEFYITTN